MIFRNWVLKNFPFLEDDFDALTDYELFCKICGYVIEYSKDNEEMKAKIAEFQHYFDNLDVQQEVNKKLDEMVLDGTLESLINDKLLGEINRQIDQLNNEISSFEDEVEGQVENIDLNKVDKNGVEQVQYANLSQEIKEMFTGGNTPVVAEDSVSTSNIVDHSVTPIKLSDSKLTNMIIMSHITTGGYYYNNTYTEGANYCYTDLIPLEDDTLYTCDHLRFADFFNSEQIFISGVSINWAAAGNKSFTTPSNAKYVRISWNLNSFPENRLQTSNGFTLFEFGDYKVDKNSDINVLKNTAYNTFNGLVANLNNIDGYYLEAEGILRANVNYYTTPLLNVNNDDSIYFTQARFVAWYNENLGLVKYDNNSSYNEIILAVPENAKYCRASYSKSYDTNSMIYSVKDMTFLSDRLTTDSSFKELYYTNKANSVTTGNMLEVTNNVEIKKNCSYTAYCEFDSFDTLYIGHGETDFGGGYLKIDNTNIYIYMRKGSDASPTLYDTIAHGLTLDDYLNIDVKQDKDSSNISITLTTSTGQFSVSNKLFQACHGKVYISPSGMTITNVKMDYVLNDLNQKVYLFGDSYIGIDNNDRFAYYLMQNDYTNILLSGYPGENSANSLTAFNKILTKKAPKVLIWTLGMNDGDSSSINSSWKNTIDTLITTCQANGIKLYLSTIPNTPTVKNTLKNAYVKASGLPYVDFAKCVGAESENATWYTGCLSSDNVHPTTLGAKLLYAELIKSVPEIIQEN